MPYQLAVFDWAGTVIDYGSFAPMGVFVETFRQFDVSVSVAQARVPMGMPKRDHIAAMLEDPDIAAQWRASRGSAPDDDAIDALYAVFVPANEVVAAQYATLVPGVTDMLADLTQRGIRVASTTGYTRSIMAKVIPVAAAQGFSPEVVVCSDDLIAGRPGPHGVYQCMISTGVVKVTDVIKVDDTAPGIGEGVSAGCLTVGVAMSGNSVGLTPEAVAALSPTDYARARNRAAAELFEAGADHVIDTVADLPALLDQLEAG